MGKAPVALVGLRCTGKSAIGRILAADLGVPFVDLDGRLAPGEDAGSLLARVGPEAFRRREAEVLAQILSDPGPLVLATGGGVVESAACRAALVAAATCVWLRADVAVLQARLRADASPRPALLGGDDAAAELTVLARRRAPLYAEVAALELDTGGADVATLARRLRAELARRDLV